MKTSSNAKRERERERDKVGKTCRDMGREDGGRGKRGDEVHHLLGKVGNKALSCE